MMGEGAAPASQGAGAGIRRARVLAIDPGSTCGFAVGCDALVATSGTWDLTPRRGESPGVRYLRLRARLNDVLAGYPDLKLVVYEQAHHRGGAATEYAAGVATDIQSWCAEHGIEHATLHSATVKKHATGKGNAKKPALIAAALARFGRRMPDDNEADALWLLDAWLVREGV